MQKTVLCVDDEVSILKAVKREFFDAPFNVLTADSAKKALDILESNSIDIVISDVKMPEIDGIKFLKIVKEKYPHINRVILSGYVEEETVFIAILQGIATTYFVKPWKPEVLRKKLEHILQMQVLFNNKNLVNTLNTIKKLPTLPKIYNELLDAIGKNKSNKEIAKIISSDISVSTRILQVVNSAYYGIKSVASIERAITLLGLNNIKDMVLTLTMITELQWDNVQNKILGDIIFHSSLVNNIFKSLYKKKFNKDLNQEISSIGITHNVGKIVLLQYFYDNYKKILDYMKTNSNKKFFESELELNRELAPHTQIGAYLLYLWNLHSTNVETALFHHEPDKASEENKDLIIVFNLAVRLVDKLEQVANIEKINLEDYTINGLTANDIEKSVSEIIEIKKHR